MSLFTNRFLLVIIFGFFSIWFSTKSEEFQHDKSNKLKASIIVCIIFIIQAGFRDYMHQMNDTINYYHSYTRLIDVNLSDLWDSFALTSQDYNSRDPGYKIFVKLSQLISTNFQFYLVLVACIISIPISHILYKYCTSLSGILIAACLYEALFANFFETGIRQTIAMGLTFIALEFYENKRYILCALLSYIAFTIHTTALIFLPVYVLLRFYNTKRILVAAILSMPIFMVYAKQILFAVGEGTIMSEYTSLMTTDNKGTPVFSAMVVGAVLLTYIYGNRIKENYTYFNLMFVTMACAIMMVPATWINSNFLRLDLYFLVFLMPLLSVFVETFTQNRNSSTTKYYLGLTLALSVLSLG